MGKFVINKNDYLEKDINGYYHQFYTGFGQPDNPEFLLTLKNTFNSKSEEDLTEAKEKVIKILEEDIPSILEKENLSNCICVCVPRAKALNTYCDSQLMLREAISTAANNISRVTDGTDCVRRIANTRTTHLRNAHNIPNDGDEPYPGITVDTCDIDRNRIMNKNIILIDDIYTKSVNIDEDCIQALLDNGANKIVFYSIGYTRRN